MELQLAQDMQELVLRMGGDFFGVADLTSVAHANLEYGRELAEQFPRAIALGVALPEATIDILGEQTNPDIAQQYKRVYDQANQQLDQIASQVVHYVHRAGAAAMPVPASHTVDPDRLYGIFSHKLVAHLAGLGWIGRSCLLITPEHGPRVRWATVLTDAALTPTGQVSEPQCGTCRRCVERCPAQAFSGRPFRIEEPRTLRFAAKECRRYREELQEKVGCPVLCGICVSVCPHGKARGRQKGS